MKLTQQKFLNPATGKMVGYVRAKNLGLVPGIVPTHMQIPTDYGSFEVTTVKMKDIHFDPKIYVPIPTGNPHLDIFVSNDGGFMPATNVILIGTPGIGKSTVGLDFIARAQKKGKKVLFISGEMNRIDMDRYCRRFPAFKELDILFLSDYVKTDPKMAIEKILDNGYDMVLIDSWAECCRTVQDSSGMSKNQAESWVLDLMEKHNEGNNTDKLFTCFLVVQQVTKNGDFLGSNRLKHMTSAMLELVNDSENERTIMEFSKNRVGVAGVRVGFMITREAVTYSKV